MSPGGTMVTCIYTGTTTPVVGSVGLNVKCPTGKRLALPGYDTGNSETTGKTRVVGMIPKTGSAGDDQLDLALAVANVLDFHFKSFALCR